MFYLSTDTYSIILLFINKAFVIVLFTHEQHETDHQGAQPLRLFSLMVVFPPRPSTIFGIVRPSSAANGRCVQMFGCSSSCRHREGGEEKNRRQEATDGVSRRNDGAAGTGPGKTAASARCHQPRAEDWSSPSRPRRRLQSAVWELPPPQAWGRCRGHRACDRCKNNEVWSVHTSTRKLVR